MKITAVLISLLLGTLAHAQDASQIEAGKKVFDEVAGLGCKTCHGDYAEGDLGVGPIIRGARVGNIQAAVEAVGEMVAIRATMGEQEIEDVAAYLQYLGSLQVVRTLSKRGRFVPKEFSVYPGTTIQLVIKNSGTKPQHYVSEDMGIETYPIEGRSTAAVVWQTPEEEGTYMVRCTDCRLDDIFTVHVSKTARPFIGTRPDTKLTQAE